MKKSWRTTTAGIIAIVGAICGVAFPLLDDDTETKPPPWEVTAAALSLGGGMLAARDNKVSSETAGAK